MTHRRAVRVGESIQQTQKARLEAGPWVGFVSLHDLTEVVRVCYVLLVPLLPLLSAPVPAFAIVSKGTERFVKDGAAQICFSVAASTALAEMFVFIMFT